MKRLDTEALRTLCAIVDQGGVTRAAKVLGLSQSAVSHKIKRLEQALGSVLLNRPARGALLTDEGARLLPYARRICALQDEALQSLSKRPLSGHIRLGLTEDVTASTLSRLLGRFLRVHPEVSVRSHVRQSLVLQHQLNEGEIDVALLQVFADQVEEGDQLLFRDRLDWVKAADLQLPATGPIPFLAYDAQCFYQRWAYQPGHHPAPGLRTVLECASSAGIASAVAAGLGVALLPRRYVSPEMQRLSAPFPPAPALAYVLRIAPAAAKVRPVRALAREIAQGVPVTAER